eukprot:2144025-Amphidinium_carterae.1
MQDMDEESPNQARIEPNSDSGADGTLRMYNINLQWTIADTATGVLPSFLDTANAKTENSIVLVTFACYEQFVSTVATSGNILMGTFQQVESTTGSWSRRPSRLSIRTLACKPGEQKMQGSATIEVVNIEVVVTGYLADNMDGRDYIQLCTKSQATESYKAPFARSK